MPRRNRNLPNRNLPRRYTRRSRPGSSSSLDLCGYIGLIAFVSVVVTIIITPFLRFLPPKAAGIIVLICLAPAAVVTLVGAVFFYGAIAAVIVWSIITNSPMVLEWTFVVVCTVVFGIRYLIYGVLIVAGLLLWLMYTLFVYRMPPSSYFWIRWTFQARRFGWESAKEWVGSSQALQQSDETYPTGRRSNPVKRMTSQLCEPCFQTVTKSGLLSGSFYFFTPREEWSTWSVRFQGVDLAASNEFCHLCSLLWYSIPLETRRKITGSSLIGINGESGGLRIKIFEAHGPRWYEEHYRYVQPYQEGDGNEYEALCDSLLIERETLRGDIRLSASVEIPSWTGSEVSLDLAKSWITECEKHGGTCKSQRSFDEDSYLPARLLYVGDPMSSALRLDNPLSSPNYKSDPRYLALSHCWGENGIPSSQKLTKDKAKQWGECIPEDDLPLNFKDAIVFTRWIGVHYIWIDSLCIVQDDRDDWERESKKMWMVYAHAYCTISSTGSADANGGCFHERSPLQQFPCHLRYSKRAAISIRAKADAYNANSFTSEVDDGPLSERAWAFQERLLSRRIVHFGAKFLFFECGTQFASEVITQAVKHVPTQDADSMESHIAELVGGKRRDKRAAELVGSQYGPVARFRAALEILREGKFTELSMNQELQLHKCWFELVAKYTAAKLKMESDRMIAILGIAQYIQGEAKGLQHLHGLWQRHLLLDLLWCLKSSPTTRITPRTPSWSWGSVNGEISQRLSPYPFTGKGKRTRLVKVAEAFSRESRGLSGPSAELLFDGPIYLECPILPVCDQELAQDPLRKFGLHLDSRIDKVSASFLPDVKQIGPSSALVCAEILRVEVLEGTLVDRIHSVWSEGIVLRSLVDAHSGSGSMEFERVGRFWAEWPRINGASNCEERIEGCASIFEKKDRMKIRLV
ncbi:heterokaryon incompatibility protein-domain-containing protein [Clohesyomyces aquaticus]|uniref:Heterokaryon incompatibility protein-domain-containing protein n=1 Tax=Clohesyomyces aquaticus TaxID=1231657 RepID=A0A1Y1ZES7_9PLEO|nr:heterokaryon incompatibility protein-domain-containing protein [Clohesyomyces aquaticus]